MCKGRSDDDFDFVDGMMRGALLTAVGAFSPFMVIR